VALREGEVLMLPVALALEEALPFTALALPQELPEPVPARPDALALPELEGQGEKLTLSVALTAALPLALLQALALPLL